MARLIIGDDIIRFTDEGISIEGHVSRLILEEEIVFIIRYVKNSTATEIRKIKRSFCDEARRFFWIDLSSNNSNPFAELIGAEIERHPHLLNK